MTLTVGPGSAVRGLDVAQLGHVRHIVAMSRQLENDWSGMGGRHTSQDDFGGYRFQLAYAAYALALAHKHRLPNAPGVFKPTFARLVEKMLLPEVWMYWRDSSRGGMAFNAHLTDQLSEKWDPVAQDNIMFSAYVQSMATLYDVLFDDNRFAEPGALTFEHWSFFWGGEAKVFTYDQNTLSENLYWQMVRSGFVGIACEPNCVFLVCNQPAIFGFRMHDLLTGGSRASEVVAGYRQAWGDLGMMGPTGHYNSAVTEDTKRLMPAPGTVPWTDAWLGALMNAWNRDYVRANYPRQIADLLVPGPDGTLSTIATPPLEINGRKSMNDSCDFGWVAVWASEMGDADTLAGLLAHADRFMSPTWRDGALFYPRNDTVTDSEGNRTLMEPMTGNSLLAYARLNVSDGWWGLYNEPWDRSHFAEPLVTEVDNDVDVTRAVFDRHTLQLDLELTRRADRSGGGGLAVRNAGMGWALSVNDVPLDDVVADGEVLRFTCPGGGPHRVRLTLAEWDPNR